MIYSNINILDLIINYLISLSYNSLFLQIKLDIKQTAAATNNGTVDTNVLALPSNKRRTKKVNESGPIKILSKKQRKRLEKIVSTKQKKASVSSEFV